MTRFVHARSPYALVSLALGLMAVVDFCTMVLGVVAGLAAVVTGLAGLRDLRRRPHLLGVRLCYAGIALGVLGLSLSTAFWLWARSRA